LQNSGAVGRFLLDKFGLAELVSLYLSVCLICASGKKEKKNRKTQMLEI
jgi:hypothetical protein